jgi:calcium-dependent protein kinase
MHPWIQGCIPTPYPDLPQTLLVSLKNFIQSSTIKKASLMYIASKLTEYDIRNIRKHFKDIDINGDGVISKCELINVVKSLSPDVTDENLQILVSNLDINDNGSIDYTEFLTGCLLRKSFSNSGYLESAFKHFDKDESGFITATEVREVLNGEDIVHKLSTNDIDLMISEIDKNRDGCIDYREFIDMMAQRSLL